MRTKKWLRSTAYLEDPHGNKIVVNIPIDTSGSIPEEPKVVLFDSRAYLQISQAPLTYRYVLAAKAKAI